MREYAVPEASDAAMVSARAVCEIFGAVGRDGFVSSLLHNAKPVANPDFVSMFVHSGSGPAAPIFLGTDSLSSRFHATRAAEGYLGGCYKEDPNRERLMRADRGETCALYLARDEVPSLRYRQLCYDGVGIVDRFSILLKTVQGYGLSISFYRGTATGAFDPVDVEGLIGFAPVVRAAAARHMELVARDSGPDYDTALMKLVERWPALSHREAQVAAGVVVGMTAEDIAHRLGIKPTSVITHRQKAYQRLAVANQRELLAKFYGA